MLRAERAGDSACAFGTADEIRIYADAPEVIRALLIVDRNPKADAGSGEKPRDAAAEGTTEAAEGATKLGQE